MGFQSKTYSLSDEVVAEIERAKVEKGLTPNKFLRKILGIDGEKDSQIVIPSNAPSEHSTPLASDLVTDLDAVSPDPSSTTGKVSTEHWREGRQPIPRPGEKK